jgi:hypothetical protein
MVAAVVQQRLCTPADLELAMSRIGRIRHKAHLRVALLDIAGGSEALSEIDVMRLCRRFRLQPPDRQMRRYVDGRLRFLDAEWRLRDGRRIVLEIDGAHHFDVSHWQADIRRERGVVIDGSQVLRATSIEVRVEPQVIAADLVRIGIPRVTQLVRTEIRGSVAQF